jgi:hypothetical protein
MIQNKLSKVAFDSNSDSKQPKIQRKIHTILWILKISRKKSANPNLVLAPNMAIYARKGNFERGEVLQCINLQGSRHILKSAWEKGEGGGGGPVLWA